MIYCGLLAFICIFFTTPFTIQRISLLGDEAFDGVKLYTQENFDTVQTDQDKNSIDDISFADSQVIIERT